MPRRPRPSYLEAGSIPAEQMRELFVAAAALYEHGPWTFVRESQALAVDVPVLRVHDACLVTLGARGPDRGFLLFDSFASWSACGAADMTGFLVALNFEPGDALPPSMRDEVIANGWPVAGADAYPVVLCLQADGTRRPPSPADVALAAVAAGVLVPFLKRHGEAIRARDDAPVSEELRVADDVLVRVRWPHPALPRDPAPR